MQMEDIKLIHTSSFEAEANAFEPVSKVDKAVLFQDEQKEKSFVTMLSGTATTQLTSISFKKDIPQVDAITGTAIVEKEHFKMFLDNFNALTSELRVSTSKLLDACTEVLTEQNHYRGTDDSINPSVVLPLDKYMELKKKKNTKATKDKLRREVKQDLDFLYSISLEWQENRHNKPKDFAKMRVCTSAGIVKGNICLTFSPAFASYLINSYEVQYPVALLAVDERNPNSYFVGRKLMLHNSIDSNIKRGTNNIISVMKLLEACPEIASYEEVSSKGRQLEQRIKTPLENALNSLSFISWEYSNSKGVPLTDEQLNAIDFKTFSSLYVKFQMIGCPDQTKRIARRTAEAEKKKDLNEKAEAKARADAKIKQERKATKKKAPKAEQK